MNTEIVHRPAPVAALAVGLFLVLGGGAWAREDCKGTLKDAETSYRAGRLADARAAVVRCLEARPRPARRHRVRGQALLAKIHLAYDDQGAASQAVADLLRLDPDFEADDPPRFRRLVLEISRGRSLQVTSVSKTPESLREAPATVEVVTAEEIERRGYLDLEAVLHDLPGFDISRANGSTYSNIYQRGYRSPTTDRTLFLVDGVEHNDLTSNVAYLSRQYPLSNIERVEVVHGPASTLYGANAFLGVINVITREPAAYLGTRADGSRRHFGTSITGGSGSWNTRYLDATVAGRTPNDSVRFSLTGRVYQSDEPDLSSYPDWDYDPSQFDAFDYAGELGFTPAQAERARELDRAAFARDYQGEPIGFSDVTDDWFLGARVEVANLELGFQTWRRLEGSTPWYTDRQRPGARNGSVWVPEQTAFSLRYNREIAEDLSFFVFSRYKVHGTSPDSSSFALRSYANGRLSLADLEAGREAFWQETILVRSSNQLRNEVGVVYSRGPRFNLLAGLELRNGSIQGDYARSRGLGEPPPEPRDGGEHFDVRDAGLYVQAAWRPVEALKLVAGGRFDQNSIRPTGGYGETFNPRFAAIVSRGRMTYKAIYAEAFKDASNFNKFATVSGTRDLPNPDLEPEMVTNIELSASYHTPGFKAQIAAYDAHYTEVVGLREVPFTRPDGTETVTGQFQNLGELATRGLQLDLRWHNQRFDVYANYTYTDARNVEPLTGDGTPRLDVDALRIGDIARHRLNAGIHARLGEQLAFDLGWNHVGDRPTGPGTTVDSSPFDEIPAYDFVRFTTTYRGLLQGLDVQFLIQNLFDETYAHPGIREAGTRFAALAPQAGRSSFLRAIYRF